MAPRSSVIALALAASLCGCSSTVASGAGGVGGDAGTGGSGGEACSVGDYCSSESCRTAEDELTLLDSLRELGVRRNLEFAFCDGRLAAVYSWVGCFFECGQCDTEDWYYDASGALVGFSYCTDSDTFSPCETDDYCDEYGDVSISCDGVLTTEGPCFGISCVACDYDNEEVCDDGNECTYDYCCFDACKNTAHSDGTPCEGGECANGVCTPLLGTGGSGGSAGEGGVGGDAGHGGGGV